MRPRLSRIAVTTSVLLCAVFLSSCAVMLPALLNPQPAPAPGYVMPPTVEAQEAADELPEIRSTPVSPTTTVPKEKRQRYHNSSDWAWLEYSDTVMPGVKLYVENSHTCSAGYFAQGKGRSFMVWAGHCGTIGQNVYQIDSTGKRRWLGQIVESRFVLGQYDYALVDVTRSEAPWRSTPPFSLPVTMQASVHDLKEIEPEMCHLGWRTGMSCGDFDEVINTHTFSAYAPGDHGDSGGPAFAYYDGKLIPAGLASYRDDHRPDQGFYQSIDPILRQYGLDLAG